MEVQGGGKFYTKSRGVTCTPPPVLLSFDNLVRSFPFAFGPNVLSSFFPVKSLFLKASGNQTSSCLSLSKCCGGTMRQARLASQWTVNPTPSGPACVCRTSGVAVLSPGSHTQRAKKNKPGPGLVLLIPE